MQRKYIDLILLAVGLCFAGFFIFNIITGNKSTNENISDQAVKIGLINPSGKEVKRNVNGNPSWAVLKKPINLYDLDTIFTGKSSTANIKLDKIGDVQIRTNTYLNFNSDPSGLELTIKNGSFVLSNTSKQIFHIKTYSNEEVSFTSTSSQAEIEKIENKKLQIKVNSGEIIILSADNKEISHIQSGSVYVFGSQPIAETNNLANQNLPQTNNIEMCSFSLPRGGENTIWKTTWDSQELSWKTDGKCEKFKVEISENETFNNIFWSLDLESLSTTVNKLPSGEFFYWRVKALTKDNKEVSVSQAEKIVKAELIPPMITSPLQKEAIQIKDHGKGIKVNAKWLGKLKASVYQVELAKDGDFKQLIKTDESKNEEWISTELVIGNYFLRVKSKNNGRPDSPWSEVHSFSVIAAALEHEIVETPKITQKQINYEPSKDDSKGPRITWSASKNAENYILEIAENDDFKNEVDNITTKKTDINWRDFTKGTFHYRIFAVSKKQHKSAASATGIIKVSLGAPVLEKIGKVDYSNKIKGEPGVGIVSASWSAVSSAKTYSVEIAKDIKFNQIFKKEKAADNNISFKLTETGTYFMRVSGIGKSGNIITENSNIEKIEFSAPMLPPQARSAPVAKADSSRSTSSATAANSGGKKVDPRAPTSVGEVAAPSAAKIDLNAEGKTIVFYQNKKGKVVTISEAEFVQCENIIFRVVGQEDLPASLKKQALSASLHGDAIDDISAISNKLKSNVNSCSWVMDQEALN